MSLVARWLGVVVAVGVLVCAAVPDADAAPRSRSALPDLGPNVTILDPATPVSAIAAALDAVADRQRDAEFSTGRHAVLFLPGRYGSDREPLQFDLGYHTEVAGLGASPNDVVVTGTAEVHDRCLDPGGTTGCVASLNFARSLANLSLRINTSGKVGCRAEANYWAVSQGVSMRRVSISGGELALTDRCTNGGHWASGGFIADSVLPAVTNGWQQQWLTRNSVIASWDNGRYNAAFTGVVGAPTETGYPYPAFTTLDTTPVSREKPFLYVDSSGRWFVRVPQAARQSRGVSWAAGSTPGRSLPLADFHIVRPGASTGRIVQALGQGKHLLFTPGTYDIATTLAITRPGTVVLGLGHPTLTAVNGVTPMTVAAAPGIVVAGLTLAAGPVQSPALLRVGTAADVGGPYDPANPITLSDVTLRVGGAQVGKVSTALEINASGVLVDHLWAWRADHGQEGVRDDTERWHTVIGTDGVVVNGSEVTVTGLFVEHFQRHNTLWRGNNGHVVLYQNELPYDPPSQRDWTQPDGTLGYPGYQVAASVVTHRLDAGGVYAHHRNHPAMVTANGFSLPSGPGIRVHHVMTTNFGAGTIRHVINGIGTPSDQTNPGQGQFVADL